MRAVQLSLKDYERLRSEPTHFGVIPGHELPDVERVVERHDHYFVVEKEGEALRQQAEVSDPRR
jgi:hypothetical protein